MRTINSNNSNRRDFLSKCFGAGSMICLGCLAAGANTSNSVFSEVVPQTGLSYEETIRYALGYSVPILKKMQAKMGKAPFFDALETSTSSNMTEVITAMTKDMKDRSMKKFGELVVKILSAPPLKDGFQYEIVENSDKAFELKFTGCIMAKLYRELNASNIGYAVECHPWDAAVKAFNPNARCIKERNMMIGDSYCNERYELA
jgi:hypothetical protein